MKPFRTKKAMQLGIRIQPEVYKRFKQLCKETDWDISKRIRYLIEKDIKNLEKQIQYNEE